MRLTDAERERLFDLLGRHAAEGSLSLTELERRVELVAGAETREAALEVLADLPELVPSPPATAPDRARWGRGHAETDRPGADWHATDERFRDPRTGRIIRVWVDGAGARRYVPES